MIKKYKNKTHEAQATEFIMELGEFVLAFERVCELMRFAVVFLLQSQGLNNQDMAYVIIGDKSSAELQVLLGALYMEIPEQDDEDRNTIKELLKRIKKVAEQRNILLHNSWNLGESESLGEEIMAVATRFRTKQNAGSSIEPHGVNPSYLRELSMELTAIQVLLQRFFVCISHPKHKVSIELNKEI